MYVGRDAFNEYAHFLHTMLHGAGVWIARVVLLTMLVLHVAATISLTRQNRSARKQSYEFKATIQASKSSRIMVISGLTILAFVVFHILHYTVRVDPALAKLGANDPYKALKTTLKAEIDEEAWSTLNSDVSRPFAKPASGRIAVKVINHLGDEVMKVFAVS